MPDLSGTILEGKYELKKMIGEGGMGAVYEATHKLIGRRLAVKFLHSQYTSNEEVVIRFQREAQAAAAIGHDNIIEVTDMGQTDDGAPFLVMEYLEGLDVRGLLAEQGALSVEEAADIMVQSLSALQAAHQAGIIHRDLKPENIYLIHKAERDNYVKLLDFGISKFRSLEGEGSKGLTQTGTVLGTPYYMSPEQARGDQSIGPKSDIYAMGVILFQMVTGVLPFDAPNYNALLIKILTEDAPDPVDIKPDLPGDLVDTIKRAMSRDIDSRFSDCSEFREHLLPYVPGASIGYQTKMSSASRTAVRAALSSTSTPLEMTRSGGITPQKKSHLPLIAGGIATLATMTALGFVLLRGSPESEKKFESTKLNLTATESGNQRTGSGKAGAETAVQKAPEPEEKPKEITLKITAEPKMSRIAIDGVIGVGNPYESIMYKDGKTHKIDISADGYKTMTENVLFDRDQDLTFELVKLELEKKDKQEIKQKSRSRSASRDRSSRRSNRKTTRASNSETSSTTKSTTTKSAESATKPTRPRRRIDDEDPWK